VPQARLGAERQSVGQSLQGRPCRPPTIRVPASPLGSTAAAVLSRKANQVRSARSLAASVNAVQHLLLCQAELAHRGPIADLKPSAVPSPPNDREVAIAALPIWRPRRRSTTGQSRFTRRSGKVLGARQTNQPVVQMAGTARSAASASVSRSKSYARTGATVARRKFSKRQLQRRLLVPRPVRRDPDEKLQRMP